MSSNIFSINILDILARVGEIINSNKNIDIAHTLGVGPQTCSNWKKRNAIPWDELFNFSQQYGVPYTWLITGIKTQEVTQCPTCGNWSDEVKEACRKLREILESGDEKAKITILNNLDLIRGSVTKRAGRKSKKALPESQAEVPPSGKRKKSTAA